MKFRKSFTSPTYCRGVAFIEAIMVIPLFVLFTLAMIDLGRWLNAHVTASRIAYEGARFAASSQGMTDGVFNFNRGDPTPPAQWAFTVGRMQQILCTNSWEDDASCATLCARLGDANPSCATSTANDDVRPYQINLSMNERNNRNFIEVRFTREFQPWSTRLIPITSAMRGLGSFIQVTARGRAPYLFPRVS